MASLYSQVEFLRNQLEEKDLLIRTLIIKDGESRIQSQNYIPRETVSSSSSDSHGDPEPNRDQEAIIADNDITSGRSNAILNSTTTYESSGVKITDEISGLNETSMHPIEMFKLDDVRRNDETFLVNTQDSDTTFSDTSSNESQVSYDRFKWEKHSPDFASRMLKKNGLQGKRTREIGERYNRTYSYSIEKNVLSKRFE